RGAAHGAATTRARGVGTRPSCLPRPQQRSGPRALHPLRALDDRQGLRFAGHGAGRAGTGVPPDRFLRGGAACPSARDPGGGGQELLRPLRSGLRGVAAGPLPDREELRGGVVERRWIPPAPASTIWATAVTASLPAPSTTSPSRCRVTPRRRTPGRQRCWPESPRRRGTICRCLATRGHCAAATRSWP